ncbi:MAG: TPM domain-containing protein [Pseudobdellovibrio sp.]
MRDILSLKNFIAQVALVVLTALPGYGFEVPKLTGPVVDQVGLLSQSAIQQLNSEIRNANQQGTVQSQILIIPSLNGESIEQVAIQIFDQWKLGDARKNNGVLILASIQDRKMRIEVGRGLEGAIPDITAKRIISEVIRPLFRTQNYDLGFILAVKAIGEAALTDSTGEVFNVNSFKDKILNDPRLQNSFSEEDVQSFKVQRKSNSRVQGEEGGIPLIYIIIFLVGLWFVILIFSPSTAIWILLNLLSAGRGGGHGSGGGWSGGGGSSAGGGASGDW